MIKVLIADDQTLFRTMLNRVLTDCKNIEVVASVPDGMKAVEMALKLQPDIVLLDIQMPEKSGIEAMIEIKRTLPSTKAVILTTFEDVSNITQSANSGADAYLIKDIEPDILIMALQCIYNDLAVVHQSAFSVICPSRNTDSVPGKTNAANKKYTYDGITFDNIDLMIIKQISQGRTNKEIAQILHYSEGSIKNRVSALLASTGLTDRNAITVFALKNQII